LIPHQYTLDLRFRPCKELGACNAVPRAPAGGGPAKFRRTGGRDRPGAGGGRPGKSHGSISAEAWSGGGGSGVARWWQPAPATEAPAPARSWTEQANRRIGKLSRGLGGQDRGRSRDGNRRRKELDAAVPRATAEAARDWPLSGLRAQGGR
jgi:hypothetical protein